MAILVDCSPVKKKNRLWYFMTSNESLEELKEFARKLGLRREWLKTEGNLPRFEIVPSFRARAIQMGAIPASVKELLKASESIGQN